MDKLKPCPFCGGNNLSQGSILMTANYIECYDCGAYGPDSDSGDWNTRTTDTALAAAEARIAEQDQYIAELRHYNGGLANESCQQQERIAALEKALEPFAREEVSGMYKDAWHLQFSDPEGFVDFTDFTIGDLRRAAALLKEKE